MNCGIKRFCQVGLCFKHQVWTPESPGQLYDKVLLSVQEKEPSSYVKRTMYHGTINEIKAVATICTKNFASVLSKS